MNRITIIINKAATAFFKMPGGVNKIDRIVSHIRISIPTMWVRRVGHDGIGLYETVKIRVIRAGKVVIIKKQPYVRGLRRRTQLTKRSISTSMKTF